ncbi:hypothetical protein Mlaev_02174 [Microbacterium laevaniformans]|uniref:DUF2304 domain-containing protein n=1 Tax=Microbacterium laevaniformans TaxID=36807 RepID=A0A150HE83_9MICO|nr:DUF2304 domain-containing protein [Microbacterium laevaniformans]KXZ59930.1 hypothetical protein Mlaev_02174 [Microbacterium laevaniformans]
MIVVLGAVLAVILLVVVLWMLLTRRLREKYAFLYLLLGVVLLVLGLFPNLLSRATALLGVQLPVNLLFAAAIIVLLGIALHQSWELSLSEDEARRLAEEVAILGARLDAIEALTIDDAGSAKDVSTDSSDRPPLTG